MRIDPPAPSVMKSCGDLTLLPERELSQEETEYFWGSDRRKFVDCRGKHQGLVDYINDVIGESQQ